MKHVLFSVTAIAMLASAAGCRGEVGEVPHPRDPVRVRVTAARAEDVADTVDAGGTVRASSRATLSSRIVATIVEVRAVPGQRVRRGEPLVLLDAQDLQAARARAEAALAATSQGTAAASAEEQAAASALALATVTHRRIAALHDRKSATDGELDEAVAGLRAAEARVKGSAARRAEAERGVDAARATVRAADVAESFSVLASPFDGIVESESADAGSLATPGMPLVVVEDDRQFRLEVSIDASRLPHVRIGTQVPISIDGVTGDMDGRIAEIDRAVDPTAHTVTIKIDLPHAPGLRTGLFGRARLPGAVRRTITVPTSALVRRGQLAFVFIDAEGTARMRLVHAGQQTADRIAILAGLADGDQVVVEPPADLADGVPLQATTAALQPAGGQR